MPRRRLVSSIATLVVLAAAGGLSWLGAERAASLVEDLSRRDVSQALHAAGQDWAQVQTDGLQVRLTGAAPSEMDRFRAVSQAGTVVDPARVVDETTLVAAENRPVPAFKIELLRNDQGISLIGLVPAATDRAALVRRLRSETAAPAVSDLLEGADHPVPDGWDAALDFGMRAARMAPRAKISVAPGRVAISALADSPEEQGRLEAALRKALPAGVDLASDISAPRPVIAPFTLRFVIDQTGARFESCAADTDEGRQRIVAAATRAGAEPAASCVLGLGAPSPDWAAAAAAAIDAVRALGQGAVTLSDTRVALIAPAAIAQGDLDRQAALLRQALPASFSLQASREAAGTGGPQPAEFAATLSEGRVLDMQGRISDARMGQTVDSVARARFAAVQGGLVNDPWVPGGWTVRVIAGLEALDTLEAGSLRITRELIRITGTSGDPAAAETVAARLADRLGPGAAFDLAIRYDRRLDPTLNLPDGPECVRQLNIVMSESEIGFEPSKAAIAGDPAPTLERLAAVMAECDDFQIEAGGHTDAQGSEGFNAELSRARAQALLAAMADAGIDVSGVSARGYGESQPIAGNDTEEGREENRRIEFRLLSDHPLHSAPLPAPVTLSGVTAPPAPADQRAVGLIGPVQPDAAAPQPRAFGPSMPQAGIGPMAPATVGASEVFRPVDADAENLNLPVQTPTPDTPRPSPRPAGETAP